MTIFKFNVGDEVRVKYNDTYNHHFGSMSVIVYRYVGYVTGKNYYILTKESK